MEKMSCCALGGLEANQAKAVRTEFLQVKPNFVRRNEADTLEIGYIVRISHCSTSFKVKGSIRREAYQMWRGMGVMVQCAVEWHDRVRGSG
ncbi:hypothetical protein IAQ61_003976, partial [Plenodomus lingam]|uniref:Predicted protein n=1 Tax=Leptosphaeria maculans (strain JN3 / isolate v23.1.3 / race Av1-4-5-6-7-8) TaxID=985895 RepID=E4ZQV2_LEPMJ